MAGAGIAGLATATALTAAGIPVRVHERARALGEVGAGVSLAPNALRVLDSFGLADRLSGIESREPLRMAHYDHRGVRFEDAEVDARGARPVHRADLISLVSWRLPPAHCGSGLGSRRWTRSTTGSRCASRTAVPRPRRR